jgi:carbon-monoxide dehydrogenase iron sulfur subunit
MVSCPTAAISRAGDFPDIVVIDDRKCISCGMCAMVCPFDVITYYASPQALEKTTVAIKCDHCIERQREGQIPACVEACKVNALEFGELNELVRAARTRYSEMVSAAVGQVPREITALPAEIEGWRGWGVAVSGLNADGRKGA